MEEKNFKNNTSFFHKKINYKTINAGDLQHEQEGALQLSLFCLKV